MMLSFTTFIQQVLALTFRKDKEIKAIQVMKKSNCPGSRYDIIYRKLHQVPKTSRIYKSSNVIRYRIIIQISATLLYTNRRSSEIEIKKVIFDSSFYEFYLNRLIDFILTDSYIHRGYFCLFHPSPHSFTSPSLKAILLKITT